MAFHGVIPYLVSPIDSSGHVNVGVLRSLIDDLIKSGVHGVCVLGSTGEFSYLSPEQRLEMVLAAVDASRGRVPVIAGVASMTVGDAKRQVTQFCNAGVDGILAILESYFPLDRNGVEKYFSSIADRSSVPVVLYTNPTFQKSDLDLASIVSLSRHPNIRHIKDASSNTGRLLSIINACGENLTIFSASAHIPAAVMMLGGVGWMSGPSCLVPKQSVQLYDLCVAKKWDEALSLQKHLWRLNEIFVSGNLAACIKAGLKLQGYDVGDALAPNATLSKRDADRLGELLPELS